jgi:predicted RNase H-like HicB family nuclease
MKKEYRFTAVFEKTEFWWIAWVEELPGANTQGKTLEEARENLKEAIEMMLEDDIPEDSTPEGEVIREEIVVVI